MLSALLLAMAMVQATPTQGAEAKPENPAMRTYLICLEGEAAKIDDYVTDASVVAIAIRRTCPDEFAAWKDSFVADSSPGERDDAGYVADTSRSTDALEAVFIERKRHAAHSP